VVVGELPRIENGIVVRIEATRERGRVEPA
jgi:hypothetical protein